METIEQLSALAKELQSCAKVPDYAFKAIDNLPETAHPMTQFTSGLIALQVHQSSTSYSSFRWFQVQSAPQEDLHAQLQELIPE
jgi:citrate synthase